MAIMKMKVRSKHGIITSKHRKADVPKVTQGVPKLYYENRDVVTAYSMSISAVYAEPEKMLGKKNNASQGHRSD